MSQDDTTTAILHDRRYPAGTFAGLADTPFVTAPTRDALKARAMRPAVDAPRFLSIHEFALLRAVCDRLLGEGRARIVDVAGAIDTRLAAGEGDGWRYDALPPDGAAMRRGLAGIESTARALKGASFLELAFSDRDMVLSAVQAGDPPGDDWEGLSPKRLFEELLAGAAEAFYAHPLAQDEIGYAGYADARGWPAVGLGARENREPEPIRPAGSASR